MTKVASVRATISSITAEVPAIAADISRVGSDISPIASQFLCGFPFPPVFAKVANGGPALPLILTQIATVRMDIPGVPADVSAVRANITPHRLRIC